MEALNASAILPADSYIGLAQVRESKLLGTLNLHTCWQLSGNLLSREP